MALPRRRSRRWLLVLWMLGAATNGIVTKECTQHCPELVPEVVGCLGSSVELSCANPTKKTFSLPILQVYWQTKVGTNVLHMFRSGEDDLVHQDNAYKNRTQLSKTSLQEGNFSLLLSKLGLADSKVYKCVVMQGKESRQCIHECCVSLKVAAPFSHPELTGPSDVPVGEEVTLNCSSSNGHPQPNVYWIDNNNGSLIDPSLVDTVIERDSDTKLYSVRSLLKIKTTSDMNITCLVENRVLGVNLTSDDYITGKRELGFSKAVQATTGLVSVVCLMCLAILTVWLCKKSLCGAYTGVAQAETRLQDQGEDQRGSLNGAVRFEADVSTLP